MNCLPGCGSPEAKSFLYGMGHAPGCPNIARHDAPPQPAPEYGKRRTCVLCKLPDEAGWYCGAHGHCRKCQVQPPTGDKFEEALADVQEALNSCGKWTPWQVKRVEAVRDAHAEEVERARQEGIRTLVVTAEHDKVRAAGVAEGRREMANQAAQGLWNARFGPGGDTLDALAKWLEARSGEEKKDG